MRTFTAEEKTEFVAKKKARIAEIRAMLLSMTDEQRKQLLEDNGVIVTIEGHKLTDHNTIFLISQSEKNISVIGGFKQWMKAGRAVKKGEKSLLIFVPSLKKEAEPTSTAPEDVFFLTANVFDISQTELIPA